MMDVKPIGFLFLGLFGMGMIYVLYSMVNGSTIESMQPYTAGTVICAFIGAILYYSGKSKSNS